jgi:hypothetical protein
MFGTLLALHTINSILTLFLFFIFLWWWARIGKATTIYMVTCFLMFGLFLNHIFIAHVYFEKVFYGADIDDSLDKIVIAYRLIFETLPLMAYVFYVVRKIREKKIGNGVDI